MTHRMLRIILPIAAIAAALTAPSSASAIMVGMESSSELVNTTQTNEQRERALDLMKMQGVQVVRVNWRWYEVAEGCAGQSAKELENHENPCYDWSRLDNLVSETNKRRMQVLISIQQNPSWLHPGKSSPVDGTQFFMGNSQAEFNRTKLFYASFHKAAATRYRNGSPIGFIRNWTVHNEPNSPVFWGGRPSPLRYAQLYGATAKAIRMGSTGARIAPGPTGPTGGTGGVKPLAFLRVFQKFAPRYIPGGSMAVKRRYLNAYAHNPYPDVRNQPKYLARRQHRDIVSMGSIDKLFRQLDKSPLTRRTKVWATEFGWQTPPERINRVPLSRQARFVAEVFDYLDSKRMGRVGRVEIGISYGLTDPDGAEDWQSGTIFNNGRRKPSFYMFQRMISVQDAALNGRVRANTRVRVWGRSNVNPRGTRLVWRLVGGKCDRRAARNGFCTVKGQRGVIGTFGAKYAYMTVRRGQRIDFAVYDTVAKRYGRFQRITVR